VRSGGKDSIVYDGSVIPFLALKKALTNKTVADRKSRSWSVVVVEDSCGMAAIAVERLLGVTSIVLRPLPELSEADPIVAGASLDAEGNPQLVLNPEGLVAAACVGTIPGLKPVSGRRPPVLVIDDSLTTRMLEQNILESAGYEVDLATSAEEALGKARQKQYGLFLVDVEMPGMDGFEFVSRTQTDAALRSVPSILVTSRNAPEDRRRGEQVGARAYIVKGDFDQGFLLQRIREFVG
jgi:two-component system chemotaxis sensor kinase CheA